MYQDGKNIKVMSKNLETNELEFKEVERAWITKEDADSMEIEDIDTGFKIICTPDHLIFTKNRGWVEAQELKEDDILDII
jgi:intein/homing endonuclease